MTTKFLVRKVTWGRLIELVEVEKETEASVWIEGRRSAKRSSYENYFDTFDEAKAFLTEYAEQILTNARKSLEHAQEFAGNVRGLRVP